MIVAEATTTVIQVDLINGVALMVGIVGLMGGGIWQVAQASANAKTFKQTSESLRDQLAETATEFRDYLAKVEQRVNVHEAKLASIEATCVAVHGSRTPIGRMQRQEQTELGDDP